jgi:hypothetical protein
MPMTTCARPPWQSSEGSIRPLHPSLHEVLLFETASSIDREVGPAAIPPNPSPNPSLIPSVNPSVNPSASVRVGLGSVTSKRGGYARPRARARENPSELFADRREPFGRTVPRRVPGNRPFPPVRYSPPKVGPQSWVLADLLDSRRHSWVPLRGLIIARHRVGKIGRADRGYSEATRSCLKPPKVAFNQRATNVGRLGRVISEEPAPSGQHAITRPPARLEPARTCPRPARNPPVTRRFGSVCTPKTTGGYARARARAREGLFQPARDLPVTRP